MHRLVRVFLALALVVAGVAGVACVGCWSSPAVAAVPTAHVADLHADALNAAVALANKAAALEASGGFGPDGFEPLHQALLGLPLTAGRQASGLATADSSAAAALHRLEADGRPLGREVTEALTRLSDSDRRAAAAGHAISVRPQIYLAALEELSLHDGAAPAAATPPDPQAVHDALAAALGGGDDGGGGPGPSAPAKHSRLPLLIGLLAVAAAVAAALVLLLRNRAPRTSPARPSPVTPATASMHSVLEASRRLTGSTAAGDIERAVVREMLGLVPGRAGALLVLDNGRPRIGHETQPGLLVPAGFAAGVVARTLRARTLVVESVVADGSFTRGGVEVALAPLITEGRVSGLMIVVREGEQFGAGERAMLTSLAPVAAAAMESAARTRAAVDASMRDPLTGVGNRRELDARLPAILAASSGGSTAFVMVDLDHFKSVNDTYGHPAGDALLRGVCAVISGALRPTDAVYRYGGEEFCLLLPGTSKDEAEQIAERVRTSIAATPFDIGAGQRLSVTASLGVAATDNADAATLVARADAALYDAKHAGRDRVCVG